jgi:hypothetical protein
MLVSNMYDLFCFFWQIVLLIYFLILSLKVLFVVSVYNVRLIIKERCVLHFELEGNSLKSERLLCYVRVKMFSSSCSVLNVSVQFDVHNMVISEIDYIPCMNVTATFHELSLVIDTKLLHIGLYVDAFLTGQIQFNSYTKASKFQHRKGINITLQQHWCAICCNPLCI